MGQSMKDMFRLSFGEEVANAISHGVMAILCLFLLPWMSVYAYLKGGTIRAVGISIYMICLFLMFLISCIYHSMDFSSNQKYVFRKLDHICIYLAIAGSYTPIALCLIQGIEGLIVLVIEWIAVLAGILLKSISSQAHPILSLIIYLAMGWAAVFFLPVLLQKCTPLFLGLIIAGGLLYTIGVYFYTKPQHHFFHFIWHLCINLASILHFIAIVFVM